MPAVRSKSISRSGVVTTLIVSAHALNKFFPVCIPVDVSNIEDLTQVTRHLRIRSNELRRNPSLSQIGTHGEIGDRSDHGDRSSYVVENAVGARDGERETSEGDGGHEHHSADSLS